MHSSKQQASLERFGFGNRDEVKNPIPLPLPVFGPRSQPVVKVKRKPGRPRLNIQAINDRLVQQRQKQLQAAASKARPLLLLCNTAVHQGLLLVVQCPETACLQYRTMVKVNKSIVREVDPH